MEVRESRWEKGGAVRRHRQELVGAVRQRTSTGDEGIRRHIYCVHASSQRLRNNRIGTSS
ncbi:hypothetical protein ZWY2020_003771 [Hordeum vulgare]|nr:hypothetical protein ZWY2020_003771 [Hordeum vulgare]